MGQMTVVIMLLTVVSKIFGFIRESVMASVIGAGEIKSIYVTATTIPDIMMYTVVAGIVSAYIPIYTKVKNNIGKDKANAFTSNLINILMLCGFVAFVLVMLFAGPISKLFSPDLSGSSLDMAIAWTRIMAMSIFTFLYSSVIRGYLNAEGNFIDPVITGIILNIIVIISTLLTGSFKNPHILIVGTLIGNVIQFVRYPFASKKRGFHYKLKLEFSDPHIKRMIAIMIPIIISSAANKISILVDKSMTSAYVGMDGVAKIFYTENMLDFVVEVITMTVVTITFPKIASLGSSNKLEEMKSKVSSSAILAMALVIPATFGLMALANPIIKLIYERNAFGSLDTSIVASLIVSYGPYIIFISYMRLLSNAFYAVGNSKSPLIIILVQQTINFILNRFLVTEYGINGIAYATSISTAIGSALLVFLFYKKFGTFDTKRTLMSNAKILLGSIIMVLVARASYGVLTNRLPLILALGGAVALAGIVYLVIILFAKIGEVDSMVDSLRKKIRR